MMAPLWRPLLDPRSTTHRSGTAKLQWRQVSGMQQVTEKPWGERPANHSLTPRRAFTLW